LEKNELPESSAALLRQRLENATKEDSSQGDLKPAAVAKVAQGQPKEDTAL
jgi:hypothetical protein